MNKVINKIGEKIEEIERLERKIKNIKKELYDISIVGHYFKLSDKDVVKIMRYNRDHNDFTCFLVSKTDSSDIPGMDIHNEYFCLAELLGKEEITEREFHDFWKNIIELEEEKLNKV